MAAISCAGALRPFILFYIHVQINHLRIRVRYEIYLWLFLFATQESHPVRIRKGMGCARKS